MTMHVRDGGIWKTTNPRIKDASTWKQVQKGSVREGGVWKEFFSNASYLINLTSAGGQEPFSTLVSINTTGVPDGAYLTYQIVSEYGTDWNTADYNITSGDGGKPTGWVIVNSNYASFTVDILNESPGEQTEYFSVRIYPGTYNTSGIPVATSGVVSITDKPASCIWALYGRPEWC
jgi:hypothetical protein